MSSAALQAAPLQPTSLPALNTQSPAASPHRHYTPTDSPSRTGYYARDESNAASPSSSKRPARRPSGNSPAGNYPEHSQASPMTSRSALASPVPVAGADAQQSSSSSSRRRHEPPVAPPRTSSTQQGSSGGGSSSRRAARAEERAANSPRRAAAGESSSRSAANGYEESSSKTRRPTQQEGTPKRGGNRDERQGSSATFVDNVPIRTAGSSRQPSREASEVLNRIIVSQPEVDVEREQERQEEAIPHPSASAHDDDYDEAAPPPVAAAKDSQPEARRSRHDHSNAKREKGSKFGDYYLGNTIGEGEFGKVKLGWKQDGGVQVCLHPLNLL